MEKQRTERARTESVVQRAIAMIEAIARSGDGVSLPELATSANVPKPTAYRLVRELTSAGLVRRETTRRGGFSAAPRLEQLALALLQNGSARNERHAILTGLVKELGETCNITVLDGSNVLYVDRVESDSPLRVHLQPGSRVPLYCTASGKLFLAQMPKALRDRLLVPDALNAATPQTIVDRSSLEAELAQVRKNGYALDDQEFVAGLVCAAVPVIDCRGRTIAAVAVQAPAARLTRVQAPLTLPALRRAAMAIATTYIDQSSKVQNPGNRR